MLGKAPKVIVVERGELLNDEQIRDAFYLSESAPIWRAIVQIIEHYRLQALDYQVDACSKNNPLALASNVGAEHALNELLADLSERRKKAQGS